VRKLSKEVWEQRVNEAGNGRYEFVKWAVDGEFGTHKKCVVRCAVDCYVWSATPSNLVSGGYGCPKCAGQRRWTAEERIEQINGLNGVKFIRWVDVYKNNKSKAVVRCSIDGHEWIASVSNLVNCGDGCPQCSGKRIWTADERIEQINSLENIEFISWFDSYKNKDSKANLRCSKDAFVWSATVGSLINSRQGCPYSLT